MYDALTGRFTFACPSWGKARVTLSSFRELERLPGAAHPAVYRVLFACGCGEQHEGLVTHEDLDWAPLGLQEAVFFNLMTARLDAVEAELSNQAVRRLQAGEWPWSFFCYPEERPRLPVIVLPPRAGRRLARGRGAMPRLPAHLGQSGLTRARRPPVAQRPRDRRRRARLFGGHRAHDRRVRRGARFRPIRRPPPRALARFRLGQTGKNPVAPTSEVIECMDSPGRRRHCSQQGSPAC